VSPNLHDDILLLGKKIEAGEGKKFSKAKLKDLANLQISVFRNLSRRIGPARNQIRNKRYRAPCSK